MISATEIEEDPQLGSPDTRATAFRCRLATVFTADLAIEEPRACKVVDGNMPLAPASGYVDRIDRTQLIDLASDNGLGITVLVRPGQFVLTGEPIMATEPSGLRAALHDDLVASINLAVERRFTEDIEKDLDSILEIMMRALSPGINDPFTAIAGIHQLGAALVDIIGHHRRDAGDSGESWSVYFRGTSVADLVIKIFQTLRPCAADQPLVAVDLLRLIDGLEREASSDFKTVLHHERAALNAAVKDAAAIPQDAAAALG